MKKDEIISSGLLEQYVLGLVSPQEKEVVERCAERYPEVKKQLLDMQKSIEEYALAHAIEPPPSLRKTVLDAVKNSPNAPIDASTPPYEAPVIKVWPKWIGWAASAAAVVIFGLSIWCLMLYGEQRRAAEQMAVLSGQVEALQRDYISLRQKNQAVESEYVVLKDNDTHHVHMRASNTSPTSMAVVYWNPAHRDALINVADLPKPPHGHQYQVWADVNGQHYDMGLLDTIPDTTRLNKLRFFDETRGFVITIEKLGGSPHPTVDKAVVSGSL